MEEKKNNKKKIIIIVGILVLIGIIGGTLAYFMARATSSEQTITSANLKIVFDDSTPIINATDIEPIEEDDILTNAAKKTFRISKESNTGKDLYARIDMIDLNISDNFKDYDLKWALYEGTNKITTGTFVPTKDGSTSINMATNVLLNSTTPKEYNLYIWINETGLEQMSLMDGSLKGKISVTAEAKKLNTLASNILSETVKENNGAIKYGETILKDQTRKLTSASNKTVATGYKLNTTTKKFELTGTILENVSYGSEYINYYTCNDSTTTCSWLFKITEVDGTTVTKEDRYTHSEEPVNKGLYVQKDDSEKSEFGFPTYYYSGAIENNYIQMGTYKNDVTSTVYYYDEYNDYVYDEILVAHANDPILWRIVRINEDGSIKLIDENSAGIKSSWNHELNHTSRYINADGTPSTIKEVMDNWYTNTITESNLDNKIQIGNFCNDISDNYNAAVRRYNHAPIFKCPNGAIVANEKAGLITADEAVFAGALFQFTSNDNMSYLNNHSYFWTMTPFGGTQIIEWTSQHNYLDRSLGYGSTSLEPRAVINLKSDVTVNGGSGSKEDPYIIQ